MKPITRKKGSVSVKIYHTPVMTKGKKYDAYTVHYYFKNKSCRAHRSKLEEAIEFADSIVQKIGTGTAQLASMSQLQMLDVSEGYRILNGKASMAEACRFYMEKNPAHVIEKTVRGVFDEMMKFKRQDNLSVSWLENLQTRLNKFCLEFGELNIPALTGRQIDDWLRKIASKARNRNNYRTALATMISFAKRRHYLSRDWNELDSAPKTKESPGDIQIFTPDEMRRMLATAGSKNIKTLLAFGGFAGMRTSEIGRLDWSKVGTEFIEVMTRKGRTPSRRLSPIIPSLARLIKPLREESGRVNTILDMNHVPDQISTASGVPWRHNGLRHSFISYRVAAIKNVAQVALECGTSEQKIFQNYRAVVTEKVAAEWFSITAKL